VGQLGFALLCMFGSDLFNFYISISFIYSLFALILNQFDHVMCLFESEIVKLLKHCFFVRTFVFMHLTQLLDNSIQTLTRRHR